MYWVLTVDTGTSITFGVMIFIPIIVFLLFERRDKVLHVRGKCAPFCAVFSWVARPPLDELYLLSEPLWREAVRRAFPSPFNPKG